MSSDCRNRHTTFSHNWNLHFFAKKNVFFFRFCFIFFISMLNDYMFSLSWCLGNRTKYFLHCFPFMKMVIFFFCCSFFSPKSWFVVLNALCWWRQLINNIFGPTSGCTEESKKKNKPLCNLINDQIRSSGNTNDFHCLCYCSMTYFAIFWCFAIFFFLSIEIIKKKTPNKSIFANRSI